MRLVRDRGGFERRDECKLHEVVDRHGEPNLGILSVDVRRVADVHDVLVGFA